MNGLFKGNPGNLLPLKCKYYFNTQSQKIMRTFGNTSFFSPHTWEGWSRVCEGHWGCLLQFWFQPKLWLFCDINIHMKTLVKIMLHSCHFLRLEDTGKKGVSELLFPMLCLLLHYSSSLSTCRHFTFIENWTMFTLGWMESVWFCQEAEVFDSVGEFTKQSFGKATSKSVQT